ncbi:MAG TPA: clostripain-related cysteine peptidase, partial [bacterium]
EVGYQIRQCAAFTVGSEETEPSEGWPYDLILSELVKHPSMTGKDLGAVIVDKYLASYSDDAVTQSACDLSKADVLASSIEGLAAALKAGLADGVLFKHLLSVRGQVQAYYVRDYVDLVDFCSLLAQAAAGSEIESCCGKVVRAVQSGYVVKQGYKGDDMRHSNGVSIYFPTSTVSPLYSGLDFDRQTQWGSFLTAYTKAIRNR